MIARARELAVGLATVLVTASASAAGVTARLDRPETDLEEPVLLSIVVEGGNGGEPRLPELSAFEVHSRGQGSQVQIINGHVSSSVTYSYELQPRRAGTFTIGPATVDIGGQSFQTQPLVVRVLGRGGQARQGGDEAYITASVSSTEAYVSEQLVYTFRFFRRVRVAGARAALPDFDGFTAEALGDQTERNVVERGQTYLVSEIKKAIFPQQAGRLVIPTTSLTVEMPVTGRRGRGDDFDPFNDFFGRARTTTRTLRAAPIEINVRPLPPAPPGFAGLVGNFNFQAKLAKSTLKVGESTTLEIVLRGRGNLRTAAEPALPSMPAFKVYDDKAESELHAEGDAIVGRKVYRRALVPTTAGDYEIPALPLVSFDPARGSYVTSTTEPIAVHVLAGDGEEPLHVASAVAPAAPARGAVEILGEDILPIHTRARLSTRNDHRGLTLTGLGVPPLAFLLAFVVTRRRRRLASHRGLARRSGALRSARKTLAAAGVSLRGGDRDEAIRGAERALKGFVGDALDVPGLALTAAEVEARLREAGAADDLAKAVRARLEHLEAATYGGGATDLDPRTVIDEVKRLVRSLERAL
jgi:hypothetical protein